MIADDRFVLTVMLRQLEYYRGIIILTTNLENQIDDAFRSRIHFHLCYPALSKETRQRIWTNCLKRVESLCEKSKQASGAGNTRNGQGSKTLTYNIQPSDFEVLAQWELNGREIKNVVRTVYLWCRYNALEFSLARLKDGIELTAPFCVKAGENGEESGRSGKRPRLE